MGTRNQKPFLVFLFSSALLLAAYIEPPLTATLTPENESLIANDDLEWLCFMDLCHEAVYRITIFALTLFITIFGFFLVSWILVANFKRFVRDGAQLASKEEGSSIAHGDNNDVVTNRVPLTVLQIAVSKDGDLQSVINEHEAQTMDQEGVSRAHQRGCCRNFWRMWSYRKIVTQTEQYEYNMSVI